MRFLTAPALFCFTTASFAAAPLRVGLDTQAMEWVVSLEQGGALCTRAGEPLLTLRDGEKVRIWWDSRGETDATDEYRIQVGPALSWQDAQALAGKLSAMGEQPECLRIYDAETWRVVLGHFVTTAQADPTLRKLEDKGFDELWVATETKPGAPRKGRALYAITDRYERRPLPLEGVLLKPRGELVTLVGKGRYRGRMEIFPNAQGRLTVVNTVDLETYLRGVVPREMGAWEFPALEALKAQAVAARTYAVANRGKRAAQGFDLGDTVADQVYGGRDAEQNLTDRAVEETRGLFATYRGKPIEALFMANSGGQTVDNIYVFGPCAYLKPASNYVSQPQTLRFRGATPTSGPQPWLTWEVLRLAASDFLPVTRLDGDSMARPLRARDVQLALHGLAQRLGLPEPEAPVEQGAALYLWMARSLGLDQVVEGMERMEDTAYFLGASSLRRADMPLAAFLIRRGIVPPAQWKGTPTLAQGLQSLGRMWQELEPLDVTEGTLLRDGQVRVKRAGPAPLKLASSLLLAEEDPGGTLRLVAESAVQIGDRVRWIPQEGGTRLLVRRLDPDGASLDRYNPSAHWKVELKEGELMARLRQKAGITSLKSLEARHNEHGRVLELVVRDGAGRPHRFTGMRIRNLLGLKDNVFRFLSVNGVSGRKYLFYGRGWGHGVGMDQTGAYGYALEGWTFEQILKHYYRGIELTRMEP